MIFQRGVSRESQKLTFFRIIIGLIFWMVILSPLYFLALHDSVYLKFCPNKRTIIMITGDPFLRPRIMSGLKIIGNDCEYMNFVSDNINHISAHDISYSGLGMAGGFFDPNDPKTIDIGQIPSTIRSDLRNLEYAGLIMHETCHAYQNKIGASFSEVECGRTMSNFKSSIKDEADQSDMFIRWKKT